MLTSSATTESNISKELEEQKKRKYQQRVLDVQVGSFTHLVFENNDGS